MSLLLESTVLAKVGSKEIHPVGWYGTPDLVEAIQALAKNWFAQSNGKTLPVNDMSLINGGLFDLRGDWIVDHDGHKGHRLGTEVDIAMPSIPGNGVFERIIREQGWWSNDRGLWQSEITHYHLILAPNSHGKPFVAIKSADVAWENQATRRLGVTLTLVNQGGLNASSVTVGQCAVFDHSIPILSPIGQTALGSLSIQETATIKLAFHVPLGVTKFRMGLPVQTTVSNSPTTVNSTIGRFIDVP